MNKRQESKAATRALILHVARDLFERQGYEAATIRGIAAEAGMSTGAVFSCFDSKSDLFAAIYGQPPLCPVQAVKLGLRTHMAEAA